MGCDKGVWLAMLRCCLRTRLMSVYSAASLFTRAGVLARSTSRTAPLLSSASRHVSTKSSPSHRVQRILNFTLPQVHSLVVDVQNYHEFVPWRTGSNVEVPGEGWFEAEL